MGLLLFLFLCWVGKDLFKNPPVVYKKLSPNLIYSRPDQKRLESGWILASRTSSNATFDFASLQPYSWTVSLVVMINISKHSGFKLCLLNKFIYFLVESIIDVSTKQNNEIFW